MAISAGVYTVGPNRDYADWAAAVADLAATLTGDLTLLQIGEWTSTLSASFAVNLNGHNLIVTCPFAHKGHPRSGMKVVYNASGEFLVFDCTDGAGGGSVTINNLYLERSSADSGSALVRVIPASPARNIPHYIHDLVLVGGSLAGIGLRVSTSYPCKVWNIKAEGFSDGPGIDIQDTLLYGPDLRIENCTSHDSFDGIRDVVKSGTVGKILNCVCFDNSNTDFDIFSGQVGSGNISQDATASNFAGSNNLDSYDGVTNSPDVPDEFVSLSLTQYYLRLKDDALVLPFGGVASEIDGSATALRLAPKKNAAGSEGNLRPGSDGFYSRGADELAEVFPATWSRRARVVIDKDWIDASWDVGIIIRQNAPGLPADFASTVRAYGDDVRVTEDAEGQEQLPVELFRYGPDDDDFTIWVAPDFEGGEEKHLYIWWGNPNATIAPFKGSGSSGSGLDGGYRVWLGHAVVFHIGNEFDDPNWCFDSSGEKRHYYADGTVTLQSWSALGEGRMLVFGSAGRCNVPNLGGASPALSGVSGLALTAIYRSSTTAHLDTVIEAVRGGNTRAELHVDQRLLHLDTRAPDSAGAQDVAGVVNMAANYHVLTGVAEISADRMYGFHDGVIDGDASVAFTNPATDATDLDTLTIGRQAGGGQAHDGQLGEIRVMNTDRDESWWKLVHANIGAWLRGIDFFIQPYAGGSCMKGLRKLKFDVPGSGPFELENTDFWLDYAGGEDGTIILTLEGIWDKVCPGTAYGLVRRQELEAIVRELAQWYQGKTGELTIDEGHAGEKVLSGVKLIEVSWDEAASNAGLIYSMSFGINLGIASGAQTARLLVFGTKALAADNYIVEYTGRDQTAFKEVFRAAPVRIPGGPPIKTVVVTAIVQNLSSGTLLQRRQQAEAIVKDWIDNYLGEEGLLTIDGLGLGTAHLLQIRAGTLDVPDAVGYDMEFAIEYGS